MQCELQKNSAVKGPLNVARTVFSPFSALGSDFWYGYIFNSDDRSDVANTDGTPTDFTNWAFFEPNNSGGDEDCVSEIGGSGNWNDLACSTMLASMCKQPRM